MLQSSMNNFDLKSPLLSSPSAGISLGSFFTPLKDLAWSSELQNATEVEVPKAEAPLWPVESVSCSTTDPKSKPKCGQDSHPEQIASVDSGETCLEDVKMAEKVDV